VSSFVAKALQLLKYLKNRYLLKNNV